jgi:hypothetical protein
MSAPAPGTQKRATKLDALRAPQLSLLRGAIAPANGGSLEIRSGCALSHPYYWAPFIAIGLHYFSWAAGYSGSSFSLFWLSSISDWPNSTISPGTCTANLPVDQ